MVKSMCFPIPGKLHDMLAYKFYFYEYFASNVPQLSWGMLHISIRALGSTPDLYGPNINMKLVNSSSQCLSYVELEKKRRKNSSEIPKFLSKFKLELHLEWLLWRSHFDFQATEFGLDK
jgi:hypothetical protein